MIWGYPLFQETCLLLCLWNSSIFRGVVHFRSSDIIELKWAISDSYDSQRVVPEWIGDEPSNNAKHAHSMGS